jgi:hypothetical protein
MRVTVPSGHDTGDVFEQDIVDAARSLPDPARDEFADGVQIAAHYRRNVSLDAAELALVLQYVEGQLAVELNGWLNGLDHMDHIDADWYADLVESARQLDAIVNHYRLPASIVLFRGMVDGLPEGSLPAGTVITNQGYVSTSYGPDRDGSFYDLEIQLTITVPAGTNAISMDGVGVNSTQKEILLPRGTRLVVESDRIVDGRRHLHVVAVQPSASPALPAPPADGAVERQTDQSGPAGPTGGLPTAGAGGETGSGFGGSAAGPAAVGADRGPGGPRPGPGRGGGQDRGGGGGSGRCRGGDAGRARGWSGAGAAGAGPDEGGGG